MSERMKQYEKARRRLEAAGFRVLHHAGLPEALSPAAEINPGALLAAMDLLDDRLKYGFIERGEWLKSYRDLARVVVNTDAAFRLFNKYAGSKGAGRFTRRRYDELVKAGTQEQLEKALAAQDGGREIRLCEGCGGEIEDEGLLCPECRRRAECGEHGEPVVKIGPSGELWCRECVHEAAGTFEEELGMFLAQQEWASDGHAGLRVTWSPADMRFWLDAGRRGKDGADITVLEQGCSLDDVDRVLTDVVGITPGEADSLLRRVCARHPAAYEGYFGLHPKAGS